MVATMNAATFMGKNFSTIQSVVKNHEDLTLKQMFDVTAQLVNNQDETPRAAQKKRLTSCSILAKRIPDQKEEQRVVSKSRPKAMNISSLLRQVPRPHRVRLHLKVRRCR